VRKVAPAGPVALRKARSVSPARSTKIVLLGSAATASAAMPRAPGPASAATCQPRWAGAHPFRSGRPIHTPSASPQRPRRAGLTGFATVTAAARTTWPERPARRRRAATASIRRPAHATPPGRASRPRNFRARRTSATPAGPAAPSRARPIRIARSEFAWTAHAGRRSGRPVLATAIARAASVSSPTAARRPAKIRAIRARCWGRKGSARRCRTPTRPGTVRAATDRGSAARPLAVSARASARPRCGRRSRRSGWSRSRRSRPGR